ncbi:MAG: T9SS type A sorting domain-containing protein, partial [Pedobacter sp.]
TYPDRFKITFANKTLGTSDNVVKQFVVYEDNLNNVLKASNPNNLSIQSFKLYDMLGKVVLSKKALGNDSDYAFSTSGLSYGIYIAEFLTTDN